MPSPPFEPDRKLFPFESKWFQSSVGQVHYLDEGSGAPILFLHGNPTWSFLYRGIVIRLRKRFRCIAVDYPGFGLSPHPPGYGYTAAEHANVVLELVKGLGLTNLTIMGQDWGGPIGMKVALDDTERVRALVMGNTWYWRIKGMAPITFSKIMSTNFMQGQIFKKNFFVERIMKLGVKFPMPVEVHDHYRGPFPTLNSRAGTAEFPREITRASEWLSRIAAEVPHALGDKPLLLTWGMHDFLFPPSTMDRFRADFSDVHITRLEAKHYIQEDAPAAIAEAVENFLGR